MDKYIKLIDICEANDCFNEEHDCDNCIFNKIPTANVQPNKKSQWQPPLMGQGKCETYCGRCFGKIMRNSTGIFEETPFCPHCGAEMRGDENG